MDRSENAFDYSGSRARELDGRPRDRWIGLLFVQMAIALILLAAGVMKLNALFVNVLDPDLSVLPRSQQYVGAVFECLVAVWIVLQRNSKVLWILVAAMFAVFFAISVTEIVQGQPSCGCFGHVEVSPKVTATLDAAVLTAVLFWVLRIQSTKLPRPWNFKSLVGFDRIILIGLLGVIIGLVAGVVPRSVANSSFFVKSAITVGTGSAGTRVVADVEFTNRSTLPVIVYGGKSKVGDNFGLGLPVEIPPASTKKVPIEVKFVGKSGEFHRLIAFFTNCKSAPNVLCRVTGFVSE